MDLEMNHSKMRAGTISHISMTNSQDNLAKSEAEDRKNRRKSVVVDVFMDPLVTSSKVCVGLALNQCEAALPSSLLACD